MGARRQPFRHRRDLVSARRRSLHRLHLHRRPGIDVRRRRARLFRRALHDHGLPFVFVVFPRLWSVARQHGYITAADFVRGRHGNKWLALAVAVTGIVATMPYIALQLVGIQVVIARAWDRGRRAGGRPAAGHRLRDPRRLHLYERAARAGGDRDRQGHPDLDHGHRRDRRRSRSSSAAMPRSLPRCRRRNCCCRRRRARASASTAPMRPWPSARPWRCSSIRIR